MQLSCTNLRHYLQPGSLLATIPYSSSLFIRSASHGKQPLALLRGIKFAGIKPLTWPARNDEAHEAEIQNRRVNRQLRGRPFSTFYLQGGSIGMFTPCQTGDLLTDTNNCLMTSGLQNPRNADTHFFFAAGVRFTRCRFDLSSLSFTASA